MFLKFEFHEYKEMSYVKIEETGNPDLEIVKLEYQA